MLQVEDLSTDILDISEQFVTKTMETTAENAEIIMALRQETIKHVTMYLKNDALCGYNISKRILLQSWSDYHPPAPVEESSGSVWNAVIRYAATDQFTLFIKALNMTGNQAYRGQELTRDRQDVIRVLTAYCAYYQNVGNFARFNYDNHLLAHGNLSGAADKANTVLLKQVAIHVLNRGKKNNAQNDNVNENTENPREHILHVIAKAHECRQALVDTLSTEFSQEVVSNTVVVERLAQDVLISNEEPSVDTLKKAAP